MRKRVKHADYEKELPYMAPEPKMNALCFWMETEDE